MKGKWSHLGLACPRSWWWSGSIVLTSLPGLLLMRGLLKPAFWANHHLPTSFCIQSALKIRKDSVLFQSVHLQADSQEVDRLMRKYRVFHLGDWLAACQIWLNRNGSWPGRWGWICGFLRAAKKQKSPTWRCDRILLELKFISGRQDFKSIHSSLVLRWGGFLKPCRNVYGRRAKLYHDQEGVKSN